MAVTFHSASPKRDAPPKRNTLVVLMVLVVVLVVLVVVSVVLVVVLVALVVVLVRGAKQ